MEKRRSGGTGAGRSLVKAYLIAYNVLSAAAWSLVLYRTLAHLFPAHPQQQQQQQQQHHRSAAGAAAALLASLKAIPFIWVPSFVPAHLAPLYQRACTAYDAVGGTTARVQSAAVLEVLHVLLGLVRSPLPTTAVQVASRLFSVWGIAARFPSAQRSPFYASMVLSWALTEVVRYTFYATALVGWEPAPLVWARYSTFFVLYPTGAGSEALVNFATLPLSIASGGTWFSALPLSYWDPYALLRAVLFVAWWPGEWTPPPALSLVPLLVCSSLRSPMLTGMVGWCYAGLYPMYTHMIKQRRKVFGGQKLGAKPKTH
ncbi:tyrosine phosphatase-like protein [Lactifluus subvellereus]|nr:tyrosine phosphatase-like protein [Lactifluus subvellereus]